MRQPSRRSRQVQVAGLFTAVLLAAGGCGVGEGPQDTAGSGQLVVAAFGGLTAELQQKHLYGPFSEETGIAVQVNIVPGQQVAGISAQNEAGRVKWDLSLGLADSDMARLLDKGYLATMPSELQEQIGKDIPGTTEYGVPSKSGAVLIVCNEALVDRCPTNAEQLFDTEGYPGSRMFPSFQPLVLIGLALQAQGLAGGEVFPADPVAADRNVDVAIGALERLKPSIKTFYSSSTDAIQLMNRGEVAIAALWNTASRELSTNPGDRMKLAVSWDQAVTYAQWDVVYKGAPNEANAWAFMKWLSDHPEQVAKYSVEAPSGTASTTVFEQIPPEVQEWLPAVSGPRAETTVRADPLWLTGSPDRAKKIGDFWNAYSHGG